MQRKGLIVGAVGKGATLRCYEGFNLAPRNKAAILEAGVFELDYLQVGPAESRHGLGMHLLERALLEAKSRGFDTARSIVRNPGMINMLGRLLGSGAIRSAHYILTPPEMGIRANRFTTQQLLNQPSMTGDQARDYLDSLMLDPSGMYLGIDAEQVERVTDF